MKYCGNYLNWLKFPNSKKNSFRGNYMRKYCTYVHWIRIQKNIYITLNIFLRTFLLLLLIFRINFFLSFQFCFSLFALRKFTFKTATLRTLKTFLVFCILLWPNKEVWVFALKSLPSSSLFSLGDVPVVQEYYHNGAKVFLILNVLFIYNFHIFYVLLSE